MISDLHSIGYVHCDIKLENILIGNQNEISGSRNIYLIDFGVSKMFEDSNGLHFDYSPTHHF